MNDNYQINLERTQQNPEMCLVCYDDLTNENSLEYQSVNNPTDWFPAYFCADCTGELQNIQFFKYCNDLANTTCAKEQRILLERGPPVNLRDKNAFPESGDTEIVKLRRAADKEVIRQINIYFYLYFATQRALTYKSISMPML